jgi:phage I-like protein
MGPEMTEADGSLRFSAGSRGNYLNVKRWTPAGKEFLPNYQDLSPTPQLDASGEVVFLHSVALVRQGCVEGLSLYSATFFDPKTSQPTKTMQTFSVDYRAALIKVLTLCGATLPDNPTDAELAEIADKFQPSTENPDLVTMGAVDKAVFKHVTPLVARLEDADRAALINKATAAGKVIPLSADLLKTVPLTTLGAMIEALPVTVPLNERGKSKETEQPRTVTLSAVQKDICKNLGLSEEAYLKTLKAEPPSAELTLV